MRQNTSDFIGTARRLFNPRGAKHIELSGDIFVWFSGQELPFEKTLLRDAWRQIVGLIHDFQTADHAEADVMVGEYFGRQLREHTHVRIHPWTG